jgi:uncharacterized protein (DUF305 family)
MKPSIIISAALALAMSAPAGAQEHGAHAATDASAADLPAICLENAGSAESMSMGEGAGDEAHRALMAGMDKMNADMMAGGTATDIDVAFICSMIPHHRGAIDMARAELEYGDDEWAKTLAQQIIVAQEKEIADMLAWLEAQGD